MAVDSGRAEHVLGKAEPAAAADDDRAVAGRARDTLVGDAAVADMDDAIGPLGPSTTQSSPCSTARLSPCSAATPPSGEG